MDSAKQSLRKANVDLALAADLIQQHMPIIEAFLKEQESVDTIMPIVNPTLWMNEERRQTAALLDPVFRSAKAFAAAMTEAQARAIDMQAEAEVRG